MKLLCRGVPHGTKHVIYHRRSIRDYTDKPVDQETVMELILRGTSFLPPSTSSRGRLWSSRTRSC